MSTLIIDHYIIRRFLGVLGLGLALFISIYLIVDIIEHLDSFIDKGAPALAIIRYYLYYLPFIVVLILPVAMLLSSLFSIGLLARHGELVALKASGISLYRILLPLFGLSLAISFLCLMLGEIVVPFSNQQKERIKRVEMEKRPPRNTGQRRDIYLQDTPNRIVHARLYLAKKKTAKDVLIQDYAKNVLVKRTDAEEMAWEEGGWILKNAYVRTFTENEERLCRYEKIERPGLRILPQDLAKRQRDPEEMGFWELKRYIDRVRKGGGGYKRWLVDLHMKVSFPFANFIIVLFGAPLASNPRRSGVAVGFVISFIICFIYWGILQAGIAMGHNGLLPPLLAAWIGNLGFGLAGLAILIKARK